MDHLKESRVRRMINIVVELSKYVILTLMIVYTVLCYYLVVGETRFRQERTFNEVRSP